MIRFGLEISHPFEIKFKNFWHFACGTPFKTKFIEIEVFTTDALMGLDFHWTVNSDHAGLDIKLSLFAICVHFNFYDNRHWNYMEDRWYVYNEEKGWH